MCRSSDRRKPSRDPPARNPGGSWGGRTGAPACEQGDQRQEIGLSLTAHGPECYRSAGAGAKGVLTNVTLVVRREGLETIYECAIPWADLPGLGPDKKTFGFGLFVNDNDGDGRRGYKEWGSIKSVGDMQALLQE